MDYSSQKLLIITNNPMVSEHNKSNPIHYDGGLSYSDVLRVVRDNIHEGRALLTHPLSGSVKPYETPYKTVLVSEEKGSLDLAGLEIIERSIETAEKFKNNKRKVLSEGVLRDFQLIDLDLIHEFINRE